MQRVAVVPGDGIGPEVLREAVRVLEAAPLRHRGRDPFPDVPRDAIYGDAAAMDLVRRPERYAVVVTSNLFGDVLSDLAAEITGGIGLAPSANLHPGRHALFEPVHGSAPGIAGSGRANALPVNLDATRMTHDA